MLLTSRNAKTIDSVVVIWSSGITDTYEDLFPDQFNIIIEVEATKVNDKSALQPDNFIFEQNYPHPFNVSTNIRFLWQKGVRQPNSI